MNPFDLSGRVALVTGGNGGIGYGIAEGLTAAGAAVMIAARDEAKSHTAVAALRQAGRTADAVKADVADEASCRSMVAATVERFGRLDILVNNAGIGRTKRPEELTLADWHQVLATNLTGALLAAQNAYPKMKRLGGGKIVNIASLYSVFASSLSAAYGASKGGMVQLTKSLAIAWAADNIQVNAILPGWIATELTSQRDRDPDFNQRVLSRTPAGRWGKPSDLAGAAVFLASPASNFVTGGSITVDGGLAVQG